MARLLICFSLLFLIRPAAAAEPVLAQAFGDYCGSPSLLQLPVYRIPLRVHLGESDRSPGDFIPILEEINDIWLSQAGICFEMDEAMDDEPADTGLDLWFYPVLTGGPDLNGYFRNDHNIVVRDTPVLQPADRPAHYPAARTAAHELGHGLSLVHRQDSDDNLMRSKTLGWQLNSREIAQARSAAEKMALPDRSLTRCKEPNVPREIKSDAP